MEKVTSGKGIKAMDALGKIQSLLAAAMYLTASVELMTIAESIAAKTLECCQ